MAGQMGHGTRKRVARLPRVIVTPLAAQGLERCRRFLAEKNPLASGKAALEIRRQFALLALQPNAGRPLDDEPNLRELFVHFGDSGYVALYRYERDEDRVFILAFRHMKEVGY